MSSFTPALRSALLADATNGASLRRWSIQKLLDFNLGTDGGASSSTAAAQNTKSLLREVQTRLAVQHTRLSTFSKSIDQYAKVSKIQGEQAQRNLNNLIQLHQNTYVLVHQIIDGDGRALLESFTKPNQKYLTDVFDQIMARHGTSVETLADAVIHTRNMEDTIPRILTRQFNQVELLQTESVEEFLHSRLMIQLLCDHYISLNKGKGKVTGAASLGSDVVDVVDDAVTEAKHVCDANLGIAPEVHIQPDKSIGGDGFVPPPLIRPWLHHAIVEVSKNAMASNVQQFLQQPKTSSALPPSVYISISKEEMSPSCSSEYLRIQIKDQGIGLKNKEGAFGFAQSTSQKRWDRLQEQQSYAAVRQPLGSLGVGLPLSRLMLRVFGGDLDLTNHERVGNIGSGCTATLRINYDTTYAANN